MYTVFVLTGPPASGKSAIMRKLQEQGIGKLVSHTTRPPRPNEVEGENYFFVSKEEFLKLRLLEKVTYDGHFYGLSKDEISHKSALGPVVVDTDWNGMQQLRRLLGERVQVIFLLIDKDTILSRMALAGEDMNRIRHRIELAEKGGEFEHWQQAEYVVKNTGCLEASVRQILAIMGLSVAAVLTDSETR